MPNNKTAGSTLYQWFSHPVPQYVPLSDIGFAPPQPVMPMPLPATSAVFPAPYFNKMLNIPSLQSIYDYQRNGRAL